MLAAKAIFSASQESIKTSGKLYLYNHCADDWDYEIVVLGTYKGEHYSF